MLVKFNVKLFLAQCILFPPCQPMLVRVSHVYDPVSFKECTYNEYIENIVLKYNRQLLEQIYLLNIKFWRKIANIYVGSYAPF